MKNLKNKIEQKYVFYTIAGELNPDIYKNLFEEIKPYLDNIKKLPENTKLLCFLAGPKIMVDNINVDFNVIHPVFKLLANKKLGKIIDFYIVKNNRLPYHAFYSSYTENGVAELPHIEESTPINWTFENKDEYKKVFSNWVKLLIEKYDASKLYFKNNELYEDKSNYKNISVSKKVREQNKSEIFFKKTVYKRFKSYLGNNLQNQVKHYERVTGLAMRNWNPYSSSLFNNFEIHKLSSI